MDQTGHKVSYTIPCASSFRDRVTTLAAAKGVNPADLARSVLLGFPSENIESFPDPGEPEPDDREIVTGKVGAARTRPWKRKPRLQVRLPPGLDVVRVRRALGLALALAEGAVRVRLEQLGDGGAGTLVPLHEQQRWSEDLARARRSHDEAMARLRVVVDTLGFRPIPDGVQSRVDALHVLGFRPGSLPDSEQIRSRYRALATILHPDSPHGSHQRMSQLNQAVAVLRGAG